MDCATKAAERDGLEKHASRNVLKVAFHVLMAITVKDA
jgi:hypothetical protein